MERTTRVIPFATGDVRAAFGDYLLLRGGAKPDDPDPVAEFLVEEDRSLFDVAAHLAGFPSGSRSGPELQRQLVTSDFGDALSTGLAVAARIAYESQAADHGLICRDVRVPNLQPVSFPEIDLGELAETKGEGPVNLPPILTSVGVTGQASVFAAKFLVSRAMLLDDAAQLVVGAVQQLSGHAARLEAAGIAAVLAANANLGDGAALIGTSNTASGGVTAAGLQAAATKLRTNAVNTTTANVANVRAAYWLVPGDVEFTAQAVVAALYAGDPGAIPRVVVNSWLDSGASYLFGRPEEAPVIARMALGFPNVPDVRNVRVPIQFDGLGFRCEHIFGVTAVGRAGVCKLTA